MLQNRHNNKRTRIIIVDDHPFFREGLRTALNLLDNIEVVAEAGNGLEFLDLIKKVKADIVFMDIKMPEMDGEHAVIESKASRPELKIITVSAHDDYENFLLMQEAGTDGYMLKHESIQAYEQAIGCVMQGGNYYSQEVMNMLSQQLNNDKSDGKNHNLTDKEIELLELICQGYSNNTIAEILSKSTRTVERQKSQLMKKTQTKNTLNLVVYAFRNNLV